MKWLTTIRLRVSVAITTMLVAALSPPRKATSARPCSPCASGSASTYMSDDTPLGPSTASPSRASGRIGNEMSNRYNGNNQRAVCRLPSLRHSTMPA